MLFNVTKCVNNISGYIKVIYSIVQEVRSFGKCISSPGVATRWRQSNVLNVKTSKTEVYLEEW